MPGDIFFDSGTSWWGPNLTFAVRDGEIPLARLNDMAERIAAGFFYLGQDSPSYPAVNFDAFQPQNEATNEHVNVQGDHAQIVRTIGAACIVLLKNERGALPLNKPKSLVLIGLTCSLYDRGQDD